MKMNIFKTVLGFVILALSFAAVYGNILLQGTLDQWKTFGLGDVLDIVGTYMWILVPIIYVLCLSFGLVGLYILYEGIHAHS